MMSSQKNIRVKLVHRGSVGNNASFWARQCPKNHAKWGNCLFTFNPSDRNYDWLVVFDDIPRSLPKQKEQLSCPRENTILVTSEPSAVTSYGKAFAAQFETVLTNQDPKNLPHNNAIRSQTGNVWFYGKTYDEIRKAPPPNKTGLISTVCSSKQQQHTMHARRYEFTQRLKTEIPELDIFGHGVRYIEKKSDALDSYKFHLAIENHIAPHVWTEKLADAFLGYTVPIYCGCPNVFDYFPEDSIIPIDISDFDKSLDTIRTVLSTEGEYERRLEAVKEARRRVIEEYNLPAILSRIIGNADLSAKDVKNGVIYNRRMMRMRHPTEFARFAAWRTGNLMQKIIPIFKPSGDSS